MRIALLSLFLVFGVICSPLLAQSAPLADNQKAVMVFDIRMDKLRGSDLAKMLNLEEQIKAMTQQNDGPDPSKISRIFVPSAHPRASKMRRDLLSAKCQSSSS